MKHILIITTSFRHGGINKSLENFLSVIDMNTYSIDIFVLDHYGPYRNVFLNCNILDENNLLKVLISDFKDLKGYNKIFGFIMKIFRNICFIFNIKLLDYIYKIIGRRLVLYKNYDSIIAYSEGVPTHLTSNINHNNKIAWIHCDYSSYMILTNYDNEINIYESYKKIVCVSEYTESIFLKIMPSLKDKCVHIHNLLNVEKLKEQSGKAINEDLFHKNKFSIITIGSFYPLKRISHIPEIANKLINKNILFKWYIIANINDSSEFLTFKYKISKYNLSEYVVYLGEKMNPYPYLKQSDLFVTLSKTEACPYVVNESKALHVPIVSTNFPAANEFIKEGIDGYIASIEEIADTIEQIIKDSQKYEMLKLCISKFHYNNEILLKKIYDII